MSGAEQVDVGARLTAVEGRLTTVETKVTDLETRVDDLPGKFAAIVDERNLFYVRSAGRKIIGLLALAAASGAGALGREIVDTLFG